MKYKVSLVVSWVTEVETNSPEEAADLAIKKCPYAIEDNTLTHVCDEANKHWFLNKEA